MSREQIEPYLIASKRVLEGVTAVISPQGFKKLSSRQLFELLYLFRYLEHFDSILILVEREKYNSALALRRVVFDTYLRGMWISRCATDEVIERARKNNFKLDFSKKRADLQQALAANAGDSAVERESKFYKRGSGFIHSGLYETAMYAIRSNPKVAKHLVRSIRRALTNTTLRLLQMALNLHVQLLQSANSGGLCGGTPREDLMSRTTSLQRIADEYRSSLSR